MISATKYDVLLGKLYAGCADRRSMSGFLRALGDATASHITTFARADLANPAASSLLTIGAGPDEILSWSEHAGENPWMQRYLPEIHAGGVCDGDAYVTRQELLASRYYDGFLRHIDTQHSVGICAAHERNRAAFLMLCRSGSAGAYDGDCIRLFDRIAPHVVNAFALQIQFEHLEAQASQMTQRQRGMFLLDAHWNWVGGNPIAEQMVAAGWWRGHLNSPLEGAHPVTRAAWKSLQSKLVQGNGIQQVVPVHDGPGQLVAFASVHVYDAVGISERAPRFVMFVRGLQSTNAEALDAQLRQIFGLTSAEAALALALRSEADIARAAVVLGIAESTARTRLQTVFEKTDMHRRADLLLMIDALAETVH